MMTAAGGDVLNVENVFSTFTYQGISSGLAINNGIALGDGPDGTIGTSTRFDGTSDSLNKSSDLSGNSNGKTFTFSFWVNPTQDTNTDKRIYHTSGSWRNEIRYGNDGGLFVVLFNNESSGGTVFEIQSPNIKLAMGGWNHVLISADLTDANKRHLYINDNEATPGWSYVNNTIDWTRSTHAIGDDLTASTGNFHGDLAHFFLDYTYRDFSVESNRRTFIDSAFGSTSVSTLSALNPIIYLPMTTGYSVGENEGTGGDFSAVGSPSIVSNGTEALAGVGQGGMVWVKNRSGTDNHVLTSNPPNFISPNLQSNEYNNNYNFMTKFTSNGFFLGGGVWGSNSVSNTAVAWTWRKAPKFFDIINTTSTGSSSRVLSHNLGCNVGFAVVKDLDNASNWISRHRSQTSGHNINLNKTQGSFSFDGITSFNSSSITINEANFLGTGREYVVYLFAHNDGDGGFGPNGDQDIIKCGTFTTPVSGSTSVDLGFEPQWLLTKNIESDASDYWSIVDSMRSWTHVADDTAILYPNRNEAESQLNNWIDPTATGFDAATGYLGSNKDHIYVAIRRGPMATPENGTDVFAMDTWAQTSPSPPSFNSGFPVDMYTYRNRNGSAWYVLDRLRNSKTLQFNAQVAESTGDLSEFDHMNGVGDSAVSNSTWQGYMWRRTPGHFDMVAYTGNGSAGLSLNHNLGVVPEMMWVRNRTTASADWTVYHKDIDVNGDGAPETDATYIAQAGAAFDTNVMWNDTAPTATQFTVGGYFYVNANNAPFIAYLFATLSGVSKVGSYTGTGSSFNVDCGFTNGARFVLIKRWDSGGDWYLWDTLRGINSGTDSHLLLNGSSGQTGGYDWIDPHSSGFTVTNGAGTNINTNNGKYLFYAIA